MHARAIYNVQTGSNSAKWWVEPSQPPRANHTLLSMQSQCLILSEVLQSLLSFCCTSSLERIPKDLRQLRHPQIQPHNFISPPLALSSAIFHSRLKTKLF